MNKIGPVIITLLSLAIPGLSQHKNEWNKLERGPYGVGYSVVDLHDTRRYVLPKFDLDGKRTTAETTVVLQVATWYPASPSSLSDFKFEDYRNSLKPLKETEAISANDLIKRRTKLALNIDLSDADVQSLIHRSSIVTKNAKPLQDTFPVILALQQDDPGQCSLLYEYLASIGYVVVSCPISERQSKLMMSNLNTPQHHRIVEERIGDLEFLLEYILRQPNVSKEKVGLFAINSEGIPALLFQMKDMQVDAIATIDGWEGENKLNRALFHSHYFDSYKMRVPYFTVFSDRNYLRDSDQPNMTAFDTLQYSLRYTLVLKGINHFFFMGNVGILPELPDEQRQAINYINASIGRFFDAYLKKSQSALSFLDHHADMNGLPSSLVKSEGKQRPSPP